MKASKKNARLPGFLVLWLSLAALPAGIQAGYKVVLKDGKVLEARTKPVSMEGHYRFTDSQNQFHSIPIQLIDVTATQAMNAGEQPKSKPAKVLTNEDLSTSKQTAPRPVNTIGNPEASSSRVEASKNSKAAAGPKNGEAYWRGRAKQIRDEIENVDRQIKALNEKTKSGKGDGIKIGFETYNSVIYADFESQVKELEKQKEKLQKMMTALEEEARKAGALPGWLR
ncbi:MAG: hypothetical protein L0387_23445 [Acidobacteria bacterium]|nr:hypothetical protein [Acidobacteriota bacterium]MCI0717575.1 hypothetical protein [Acidobacteriota bacterium]